MATMVAVVSDLEPHTPEECLVAGLDSGIPDAGHDCSGVQPRQVKILPRLRRMYPIMCKNRDQPPWEFRDSRGLP